MTYRENLSPDFPNQNVSPQQQQSLAWLAIGGLIVLTVGGIFGGAGGLLRQVFPVASFLVGIFLYARYPVLYIGYTWWIWFLIALIRRLIDFKSGWVEPSPILVTPFLVTLITFYTFIRHLPKSYRMGGLPFILAIFSVIYGFLIGLVNFPPIVVVRTMLDWLTPVLFGFHIFVNWRNYPSMRENTKKVFVWGVLVTGGYGVVQYLIAPEWDRFWLIKTKLTTFGNPVPLGIRVWSTMHSPGPFAAVMMAGLILLFSSQSSMRIPASIAGYLSFLLSMARAAWGGWLIGLISMLSSLKPKLQKRLIVTILVMVMAIVPLVTIEPFATVINKRFESFSNIEKDQSYRDRSANYNRNINLALTNVLGNGIGGTWAVDSNGKLVPIVLDSGILDTLFSLGWFGGIPYIGGLFLILYTVYQSSVAKSDPFANAARSIGLAIVFQLIFSSLMTSIPGVVLWGFLGFAMAAKKYHQHQQNSIHPF